MKRHHSLMPARITTGNLLLRGLWQVCWTLLYRPSPTRLHIWRRWLLRLFGAHIGVGARPYPRVRIWAPWNLTMQAHSCMGNDVDCYCVAPITLGAHAVVSQYSYLCSASHDIQQPGLPLVSAPIILEAEVWVAADVFIGPGVTLHEGAVVGARSTVIRDVEPWTFVAGNPPLKRNARRRFTREAKTRAGVAA